MLRRVLKWAAVSLLSLLILAGAAAAASFTMKARSIVKVGIRLTPPRKQKRPDHQVRPLSLEAGAAYAAAFFAAV
jgi:hypothetical protein